MSACAAFDPAGPYAAQALSLTDCHALALAQGGYQALSGGGGALAGLLTVFVALLGYRLMLGHGPSLGEGAGLLARVALVMALVTQWPAYQALVFDVVMGAPRALAGALTTTAGLGPVDAAAQAAQVDALAAQAAAITATPDPIAPLRPGLRIAPAPGLPAAIKTPVHWGNGVLVATVLAGWISTRLVAAVLLGLGPVLGMGLLFAGTRGLALGWLRALIGAALGQVVVAVVAAMELALAQGQMAGIVNALNAGDTPVAMADGLLTTAAVFAAVMLAGLLGVARVATLAWPKAWRAPAIRPAAQTVTQHTATREAAPASQAHTSSQRVERVAAAARAMDRHATTRATASAQRITVAATATTTREDTGAHMLRLGQSARRPMPRTSRQAAQRDAHR